MKRSEIVVGEEYAAVAPNARSDYYADQVKVLDVEPKWEIRSRDIANATVEVEGFQGEGMVKALDWTTDDPREASYHHRAKTQVRVLRRHSSVGAVTHQIGLVPTSHLRRTWKEHVALRKERDKKSRVQEKLRDENKQWQREREKELIALARTAGIDLAAYDVRWRSDLARDADIRIRDEDFVKLIEAAR